MDRAWRVVDEVFPLWAERIADTKRGTLWRPIRKLYKKAKAALGDGGNNVGVGGGGGGGDSSVAGRGRGGYPLDGGAVGHGFSSGGFASGGSGGGGPGNANHDQLFRPAYGGDNGDVPGIYDGTTMPNPAPNTTIPVPDMMRSAVPLSAGPWMVPATQPQPEVPSDVNKVVMSPSEWFSNPMAWPDISFDASTSGEGWDTMDWSIWEEFLNDTNVEGTWTSPSDKS